LFLDVIKPGDDAYLISGAAKSECMRRGERC
jgi:hypothetical protein